jgi:hypothetical protein
MPVKDEWSPRPSVVRREGPTEPGLQVNWHLSCASYESYIENDFCDCVYEKIDIEAIRVYVLFIE